VNLTFIGLKPERVERSEPRRLGEPLRKRELLHDYSDETGDDVHVCSAGGKEYPTVTITLSVDPRVKPEDDGVFRRSCEDVTP